VPAGRKRTRVSLTAHILHNVTRIGHPPIARDGAGRHRSTTAYAIGMSSTSGSSPRSPSSRSIQWSSSARTSSST
jgi:hypothetical protein